MTWKLAKRLIEAVSFAAFLYIWITAGWIAAFGWVYSLAFAFSAIPEMVQSIKRGYTEVADGTLKLWMVGEVAGLVYGFGLSQMPIIFNCGLNAIFVGIIVYYKLRPRRNCE